MSDIVQLEANKDEAWDTYEKLNAPAEAAYKQYKEALAKYKEAVIYEQVRKKVIRDLLAEATKYKEKE